MSVHRAQREISCPEFAEWKAYYRLDPHGEDRADLRMGILAMVLCKLLGKRGAAVKPETFMPKFAGKRKQTPAEMWEILKQAAE